MTDHAPDILACATLAAYLTEATTWWIQQAPERSLRAFARRSGVPIGTLTHVMRGTRKLDPDHANALGAVLELDPREVEVLLALARFERSEGNDRDRYELQGLQRMLRAHRLGTGDAPFLEQWTTAALRELARLPDFRPDPVWIADTLRPRISVCEAEQALKLVLGSRDAIQDLGEIVSTGMQTAAGVAGDWHQQILAVAQAGATLPKHQRYLQSYIVAVSPDSLPLLIDAVNRFVNEVAGICEPDRDRPRDRVLQVSLQVVPMTDPDGVPPVVGPC